MTRLGRGVLGVYTLWSLATVAGCDPQRWRYVDDLMTSAPAARVLSVALTGDMQNGLAAVGEDSRVDVFTGVWGTWTFRQKLSPASGAVGAFGTAVAIDGDTLAVGAPHNGVIDGGGYEALIGYVEIFRRDVQGHWAPQQTVTPSTPTPPPGHTWPPTDSTPAEFYFGGSVALEGDTLVVGAGRFWDGIGRAFVFKRAAGQFAQVAELAEADANQRMDANFGDSVRISGGTIAVSRPDTGATTPPPKAGKVYLYAPSGAGWGAPTILQRSPTPGTGADGFGNAIALSGDHLAVRHNAGVQVFTRTAGVWSFAWETAADFSSARGTIDLGDDPSVLVVGGGTAAAGNVHLYWPASDPAGSPLNLTREAGAPVDAKGFGAAVAVKNGALLSTTAFGQTNLGAVLSYVDGPY